MAKPTLDDLITHVKSMSPDGDALSRLTEAVVVSQDLGELADHLVGHFVDQARRAGASWTDIGQSMGVTKQAAQKRFVAKPDEAFTAGAFERFTARARYAVVVAQEQARAAGNAAVEPEHVLLGVVGDHKCLAARAIVAQNVTLEAVRGAAIAELGPPEDDLPAHLPFSSRSKKLLQLTVRESLRLGHSYVGTEHMLLGLFSDESFAATQILLRLGVDPGRAQTWINDELRS